MEERLFDVRKGLELKIVIRAAEDDAQLIISTDCKLTSNDWDIMPKLMTLLKPIYTATLFVEGDQASISDIIPIIKRMKMELEQVYEFGTGMLESKLLENIHNYLEGGDIRAHFVTVETSDVHTFATLLDPRYKGLFFQNKENPESAKQGLKCVGKDFPNSRNSKVTDPTPHSFDPVEDEGDKPRSFS
ncbi:Zinc finger BED domain-containing protein 4-like [Oopsacas minuta]|uniref:Zinc finger BED domain-containing protein 4-like n=1 Tax=Oopsacas minuta TaxID=111878 RepID=A0AAV7KAN6_9METZ|nr:Zinc finger BED domain-containing protein 4-like [Oopsacas minuta]